jgi:ankyrin
MVSSTKAPPTAINKRKLSLLRKYLCKDNPVALKRLLDGAFDVRVGKMGETPLIIAAYCGALKCARLLIELGANPNSRANEGMTPLIMACHVPENYRIVELLCAAGADIDAVDDLGNTALYVASLQSCLATVMCLLSHGAKAEISNRNGATALTGAITFRRHSIAVALALYAPQLVNLSDKEGNGPFAHVNAKQSPKMYWIGQFVRRYVKEQTSLRKTN